MAIDLIRISGALLIFLCHACSESDNLIGGMLGQLFNVGVPIFFILSGYLHSLKNAPVHIVRWYAKKLQRLIVPLYIFLAFLAIVYCINGHPIDATVWLQTAIPICGLTQNYISGCGQLWFLTHLLICYLITPLLQRTSRIEIRPWLLLVVWSIVAVLLAYSVPQIWCTLWNSLFNYCVGFYAMPKLLEKRCPYALLVFGAAVACVLRLVFRAALDETPFYNTVVTEICSIVLAGSIFIFLYQMGLNFEKSTSVLVRKATSEVSKRTYEFYLSHYIFLSGYLRIRVSGNVWIDAAVSFVLAVILAEMVFVGKRAIEKCMRKFA